jgi:hypothetical protein
VACERDPSLARLKKSLISPKATTHKHLAKRKASPPLRKDLQISLPLSTDGSFLESESLTCKQRYHQKEHRIVLWGISNTLERFVQDV